MWLQVVFLWPHSPPAEEIISLFDVFIEPQRGAILLFSGRTLPTPHASVRVVFWVCTCRSVGSQHAEKGNRAVSFPPVDVFDVRYRRYFQHANFMPIVGVEKRGVYYLFFGNLPRQHSVGAALRFTGPGRRTLGSEH